MKFTIRYICIFSEVERSINYLLQFKGTVCIFFFNPMSLIVVFKIATYGNTIANKVIVARL